MTPMREKPPMWDEALGLIYQAAGGDLDGQAPEDWARSVRTAAAVALDAVRELRRDYDAALEEESRTGSSDTPR